ncbi:MAG: helix-turn-helix transcriptional regulator [Pseudomonadota bacterium]
MSVQVITRNGEAEYAILPWAEYQALLKAAERVAEKSVEAVAAQSSATLDQLAMLREARGLTAEHLARSVGISPHYLAMIERGERQPDAAISRALAWNLGVSALECAS